MKFRHLWLPALAGGMTVNAWALAPVVNDPNEAAEVAHLQVTANKAIYDLTRRIEQLQLEVRDLTGKVEEQTHQNAELKKKLGTMYSDFDERVQNLENRLSGGAAAAPGTAATGGSVVGESEPFDFDTPSPAAPEAAPPSAPAVPPPAAPAPAIPPAAVAPAAPPAPSEPAAVTEDMEYKQAYDDLRNGRTAQSIEEFKAYLGRNPAGPLSGNAQYWLGEAHRVNQDFPSARAAFNKVLDSYPNSPKVPDALLKLGYLEIDLNNAAKAREYLTRVTSEFPSSNAARLAAKKLQTLGNP